MRNGTKTLTTLVKEELNRHPCADTKSLAKILPIQRRTVIANKRIEELINERNVPTRLRARAWFPSQFARVNLQLLTRENSIPSGTTFGNRKRLETAVPRHY
jgi:hypothetical protein